MVCQCSSCLYVNKKMYLHCDSCFCESCNVKRAARYVGKADSKPSLSVQLNLFDFYDFK